MNPEILNIRDRIEEVKNISNPQKSSDTSRFNSQIGNYMYMHIYPTAQFDDLSY